jgi:glycerol-3-phosphate dehydrogenase
VTTNRTGSNGDDDAHSFPEAETYDLAVVGGGINGVGIAADAAGRGLSVVLLEQNDLASGTSSASSKLIHGGLRYLEHREFRLVAEALAEREVLMAKAPHLIRPLRFVLPHVQELRPRWMIRAGLLLYDHLARRRRLPASRAVSLAGDPAGRALRPELRHGFAYWDCWVDDARLVVANARAAADHGARILTRTRLLAARIAGTNWALEIETGTGARRTLRATALVNAAGPWLGRVAAKIESRRNARPAPIRLVQGSHLVLPRIPGADDAYILQSPDKRVVFALPYEEHFTLIGTTDRPFDGDPADVVCSDEEERYLLEVCGRFFRAPLLREAIVRRFAGVRSLFDDGSDDPSAVTRDYRLELEVGAHTPPLLSVYGGKVTTFRRLAEEAIERLRPHLAPCGAAWTERAPLPGGDIRDGDVEGLAARTLAERPALGYDLVHALVARHGSLAHIVLGNARRREDLGRELAPGLTEAEVTHMGRHEWARTADDVLWRRTKCGLHLDPPRHEDAVRAIEEILAARGG